LGQETPSAVIIKTLNGAQRLEKTYERECAVLAPQVSLIRYYFFSVTERQTLKPKNQLDIESGTSLVGQPQCGAVILFCQRLSACGRNKIKV
jgi:hypothetical protein